MKGVRTKNITWPFYDTCWMCNRERDQKSNISNTHCLLQQSDLIERILCFTLFYLRTSNF